MHYMTSIEKIGYNQGLLEGEREGLMESKLESQAVLCSALMKTLRLRFGLIPSTFSQKLEQASLEELDQWLIRALEASQIEEVFWQ